MLGFQSLSAGVVAKFEYPQVKHGLPSRFVKITEVRDLRKNPLRSETIAKNRIERGRYLVRGVDTKGNVRCYYPELCDTVYIAGPIFKAVWYIRKLLKV